MARDRSTRRTALIVSMGTLAAQARALFTIQAVKPLNGRS